MGASVYCGHMSSLNQWMDMHGYIILVGVKHGKFW